MRNHGWTVTEILVVLFTLAITVFTIWLIVSVVSKCSDADERKEECIAFCAPRTFYYQDGHCGLWRECVCRPLEGEVQ